MQPDNGEVWAADAARQRPGSQTSLGGQAARQSLGGLSLRWASILDDTGGMSGRLMQPDTNVKFLES